MCGWKIYWKFCKDEFQTLSYLWEGRKIYFNPFISVKQITNVNITFFMLVMYIIDVNVMFFYIGYIYN